MNTKTPFYILEQAVKLHATWHEAGAQIALAGVEYQALIAVAGAAQEALSIGQVVGGSKNRLAKALAVLNKLQIT